MKEIPLTKGYIAFVDDEDHASLAGFNWHAVVCPTGPVYAARSISNRDGTQSKVYMHRIILGAGVGEKIDHIDRDGLNNRRGNLRKVDWSQSNINRGLQRNNSSGYRGVTLHRRSQVWQAAIKHGGVTEYIGSFASPRAAAEAYDERAKEVHGSFAQLNFPVVA